MFHKVKDVRCLPGYKLSVSFAEGVVKIYDMNNIINEEPAFSILATDGELFYSVHADVGGYGISWNDDIDLSCDELWNMGEKIDTPFDELIALSDATTLWDLNESTLRKAISYGKLVPDVDVCKYGKQWVVTRSAMEREYGKK